MGFKRVTVDKTEVLEEGRPRLIKFIIARKAESSWVLTNAETQQEYLIDLPPLDVVRNLCSFVNEISAYDEYTMPRTNGPADWGAMSLAIYRNQIVNLWVPENKIPIIANKATRAPSTVEGLPESTSQTIVTPPAIDQKPKEEPKLPDGWVKNPQLEINSIVRQHLTVKEISEAVQTLDDKSFGNLYRVCLKEMLAREMKRGELT